MARIGVLAVAVIGVALLLFVMIYAVDATAENSRHDITVTNETFAPAGGEIESFNNSDLARADYDENVTVRNESDESTFDPGGNYTWIPGNGTLRVTAGGELANAAGATITYGYFGQTTQQTEITTILIDAQAFLGPVIILVGFAILLLGAVIVLGRAA